MARKQDAPRARPVTADDVDPRHRWDRPLQAPGHTQVEAGMPALPTDARALWARIIRPR